MKTRFGFLMAAAFAAASCTPVDPSGDGEVHLRPNGDVLAAASTVDVREAVPGDVMMAAATAVFDGEAGGSVLAAGRDIQVRGRVDGSVRAVGGSVTIHSNVGRNVTAAGAEVTLDDEAVVIGNAYVAGGKVRLTGVVEGDLYVGANEAVLDGPVGGDVRVEAHTLRLGPDARIEGELRYRVDEEGAFLPDAGARVAGEMKALPPRAEPEGPGLAFLVGRVVAFLLAGAALVALIPGTLTGLLDPVEHRPAASAAWGVLTLFAVPIGVAGVAATVVGLPLAISSALLLGLAWYFAPVVPSMWIGREMLGLDLRQRRDALKAFLVGGAVVGLAGVAPWIGFFAHLLAAAFGLGALALTVNGRRRPRTGAAA